MLINLYDLKRIEQILGVSENPYDFTNESWESPPDNTTYHSGYIGDRDCQKYIDSQKTDYYTGYNRLNYFSMDRNSIYLRKLFS